MIIRWVWPDCNSTNRQWGEESTDSFWLEATEVEAEDNVFPLLPEDKTNASRTLASKTGHIAEDLTRRSGIPYYSYCFLVSRHLESIEPFQVHYPFHQMWNAYSPFIQIEAVIVDNLEMLAHLKYQICKR